MRVNRKDKYVAKVIRVVKRITPALPPVPGKAIRKNRDPFLKPSFASESETERIRKTATSLKEKNNIRTGFKNGRNYERDKTIKDRITDEEMRHASIQLKKLKSQGIKTLAKIVEEERAKGLVPKRSPDGKIVFFVKP